MKPDTHTVKQLFERDIRYQVPLYQRPYVWNEEEQREPLWDDLGALLTHQETSGDTELWSHFLGAIVLDQEKTAPGRIPRYTLIDGQQRLTTLQLLIAAVAKAAAAAGAGRDAKLLRRLVENDPLEVKDDELLKVWPTNANRVSFAAVMRADGPPIDHVNDAGNLIDEAFEYFARRATEYLLSGDDGETPTKEIVYARAELLRITLCDLLKVVSITLEKDDNAQVIFETLNARGTPLLSLDLVKNSVFRQASIQGRDTDTLYERLCAARTRPPAGGLATRSSSIVWFNRNAYDVVRQPRLVMALAAVESSLRTNKTEPTIIPTGLSLEHLLPQEWGEHWPLPDEPEMHAARDAALHKLGNLTVVTGRLNSTMQNAAWSTKRAALNQHSVLLLNARLAERDSWDEAAIEERGRWLATRLANVWPGPTSDAWKGPA